MRSSMAKAGIYLALILVAGLLGLGFISNSILLPLSSYPIQVTVTVKNANTLQPIANAAISSYHVSFLFGIPLIHELIGTSVTGSAGTASVSCLSEADMVFDIIASGYEAKTSETMTFWGSQGNQATVYLTPNGSAPTYVTVKVYTVTSENYAVRDVKITGGVAAVLTGSEAYANILCSPGTVALSFDGSQATFKETNYWQPISFAPFSATITAAEGKEYTATVTQGIVTLGKPQINNGGTDFWGFMLGELIPGVPNWALVAVAAFLILRRD
jgi:hypothetical protein